MKATLLTIGALAFLLIGGCSEKAKDDLSAAGDSAANAASHTGAAAADETKAAADTTKEAAAKTTEAVKDAGANVAAGAEKAGAAVKNGAENAAGAVAATGAAATKAVGDVAANTADAAFSAKVKTNLLNSAGLETKNIDVDTVGKTVTLKGSVPDAKQKKQAEESAKATAGSEYKVVDNLTVAK